jgi:hypothetical protein
MFSVIAGSEATNQSIPWQGIEITSLALELTI